MGACAPRHLAIAAPRTRFNGFYPDTFVEGTTSFEQGGKVEVFASIETLGATLRQNRSILFQKSNVRNRHETIDKSQETVLLNLLVGVIKFR